jgi:hypothetical protein
VTGPDRSTRTGFGPGEAAPIVLAPLDAFALIDPAVPDPAVVLDDDPVLVRADSGPAECPGVSSRGDDPPDPPCAIGG